MAFSGTRAEWQTHVPSDHWDLALSNIVRTLVRRYPWFNTWKKHTSIAIENGHL